MRKAVWLMIKCLVCGIRFSGKKCHKCGFEY